MAEKVTIGNCELWHGDALEVLPTVRMDALITDPPYSSGGAFRGDRDKDTGKKYLGSHGKAPTVEIDFVGWRPTRDTRSHNPGPDKARGQATGPNS